MTKDKNVQLAEDRVGTTARKWTLDSLIDIGGMAAVYRATHRNGNRVAVKVLHPQYAEMPEVRERFMREGYVANKVGHPAAVTVLDDDELDDGTPFIVMELLDGYSLEGLIAHKHVLSPAEALYVADRVLDVLGKAHQASIIHRDIKPGNVFLTKDGQVKVLDFGLARALDGPASFNLTRTGTVLGTAGYMSPEQARGKRELIDHRTDIFAVGGFLFRALTGRPVHTAKTPVDRMLQAMSEPAPSLASVTANAPADLVQLVDKALAFNKEERWPDAYAMQAALRSVYEKNMGQPLPGAHKVGDLAHLAQPPAADEGDAVSVVFDDGTAGDSIFVDVDDDGG
ncbi:MAG: serine/threonine protein kinase [Deltaproteobacteria bacterium]|jgi:serine/threonine-protein kinase|nr:serine/threonine protein kinase [Deltaproteobacteria bacterium]MBW2533626.1 serine/threonine protein kinase [Deltaproteobacteria bacterium]